MGLLHHHLALMLLFFFLLAVLQAGVQRMSQLHHKSLGKKYVKITRLKEQKSYQNNMITYVHVSLGWLGLSLSLYMFTPLNSIINHKLQKVTTLITFTISNLWGSLLSGWGGGPHFQGSLSGSKNCYKNLGDWTHFTN